MGIRVTDIAYVRFRAPDLDAMEAFLIDFGMQVAERTDDTLYMRAANDEPFVHVTHLGDEPGFIGLAFDAESEADLDRLAALDDCSAVEELTDPGGGQAVRFDDPDGFQVEVVAGRASVDELTLDRLPTNNRADRYDRRGETLRIDAGPSQVKRLGHAVLNVTDFRVSEAWYKDRFGLITSDEVAIDEERALGAFMRCDQGDRYVDHHTLFLVGAGKPGYNHAAFEVVSIDDLMAGHTHLAAKEYDHNWGVGRHILGSQVFDYWKDPFGHVVEHWTDGDLFNASTPPGTADIPTLMGSQWGPTTSTLS